MDLTQLADLGEFIGGVAVLVTLIYLALQVRQTNRTASAAAFNSVISLDVSLNSNLLADRDVCDLIVRAREGLAAFDEVERLRFGLCASTIFRVFDNYYEYELSGLMTQARWTEREVILRNNFSNHGLREYWAENSGTYTRDFQSVVNRVLEEHDADSASGGGLS